jgi:hypothetical protein
MLYSSSELGAKWVRTDIKVPALDRLSEVRDKDLVIVQLTEKST